MAERYRDNAGRQDYDAAQQGVEPVGGRRKIAPTSTKTNVDKTAVERIGGRTPRWIVPVGLSVLGLSVAAVVIEESVTNGFIDYLLKGDPKLRYDNQFDNTAEKTAVGKNIHFIPSGEVDPSSLKPIIDKEAKTITFYFPIGMSEGTTGTIQRTHLEKGIPSFIDPTKLPPIVPIDLQFDHVVDIRAPEKSHMYLIRGNPEFGQDPNFPAQVRFYKYYPKEDTTVVWWFNSPFKEGHFVTSLPMQDFDKYALRGTNYEKLPEVEALTEVMTTSEPNQPFQLDVMAYRGKVVGPEAEIAHQDFLLEPKFQTTETRQLAVIAFNK